MAKRGFSECKGCGITVLTEECIVSSGKKYCESCGKIKVQEAEDYKDLIKTICEYFEINAPSGLMTKHIKDYKAQYEYSYSGMNYTLWYCKEIKGIHFDIKYGLAILKYEYKNAEDYFLQQQKIQESVQINGKIEEKVREVKIKSKKQERKSSLIDLDKLIKEGEM